MPKDKYTATWVSHTSLSDYIKCPRAYFLKNVYKDPQTGQLCGSQYALEIHHVQAYAHGLTLLCRNHNIRQAIEAFD